MKKLMTAMAFATLLFSSTAYASHYDIADVEFIEATVQQKLLADGLETTADLLDKLLTASDRKAFSKKYAMDAKAVDALAHKLELMQITGVGPKAADLLILAGVKNVKGLAAADANALLDSLLAANRQHAITGVQPDMTVVKDWIAKAKKVAKHLA